MVIDGLEIEMNFKLVKSIVWQKKEGPNLSLNTNVRLLRRKMIIAYWKGKKKHCMRLHTRGSSSHEPRIFGTVYLQM